MQVGCIFILVFSVVTFLAQFYWYLELLTHFRLQYLILSVVFLVYFKLLKNKIFIAVSIAVFLINIVFVIPSYVKTKNQEDVANRKTIKLFHSNVLTSNKQYLKLIDLVYREEPDVVILQEVNKSWLESLTPIKTIYQYFIELPRSDNFGIALFSKIPISEYKIHRWTNFDLPSIEAKLVLDGIEFHIIATHPLPPVNKKYYDARNLQIKSVVDRVMEIDTAKIVIGDLNTSTWSANYKVLESGTGLLNASRGFGIIPTWPTNLMPLMIPIDHCLVSKHFNVVGVKSGEGFGSDHLPLIVELEL